MIEHTLGSLDAADAADGAAPAATPNPLLESARPTFASIRQMRRQIEVGDLGALADALAEDVARFERAARDHGVADRDVFAARHALCALIDEAASGMPWGAGGVWDARSLLQRFHQEPPGANDRVFALLSTLAQRPDERRPLLEFLEVCIALGLEGAFRGRNDLRVEYETLRARLRKVVGGEAKSVVLSDPWTPAALDTTPPRRAWVRAAISGCALVVVIVFLGASAFLATRSDAVFATIQRIGPAGTSAAVATATDTAGASAMTARLRSLGESASSPLVTVREGPRGMVLTLASPSTFDTGSAQLEAQALASVDRVGQALVDTAGVIVVEAHVDTSERRGAGFPSAWHLADARMKAVGRVLAMHLPPERLRFEAYGETDGKASGRVDILLYPSR